MRLYRFNIQANLILLLILSQLRSFPAPKSPCVRMRPHQVALSNKQGKWSVDSPFFSSLLKSTIEDLQELNKTEYRKVAWERMIRPIRYAWKKKKKHTSILKKEISRGKKATMWHRLLLMFFSDMALYESGSKRDCVFEDSYKWTFDCTRFHTDIKCPQAFWA